MPNAINLLNQTFGNWLVVKKLPSKNKKTYWLCKCQKCGKEKEIQTCHLRNNTYEKCCDEKIEIRQCSICGKNFKIVPKGYTRHFCYECSPSYDKEQGRAQNISEIKKAIKKQLVEYKGGKCEKCGYDKCMRALHFHHINPKKFEISAYLRLSHFNMQELYEEVDKCQLLCANCHAEIHEQLDN